MRQYFEIMDVDLLKF